MGNSSSIFTWGTLMQIGPCNRSLLSLTQSAASLSHVLASLQVRRYFPTGWAPASPVSVCAAKTTMKTALVYSTMISAQTMSTSQLNGHSENGATSSSHHDILLSLIPGDKSKRSIRIYPASRPTSKDAQSLRSKSSFAGLNAASIRRKDSSVLVTLDVDLP